MSISRHSYAILGLATILTAISVSSTHRTVAAGFANPQPVIVTNTSGNPVQTTVNHLPAVQIASGQTVGITGTPDVTVSTLPAVQFADGSNVAVNNAMDHPIPTRDAEESSRVPAFFQKSALIPNGGSGSDTEPYVVPDGKVLVITDVSIRATMSTGQGVTDACLKAGVLAESVQFDIPMIAQGPDPDQSEFTGSIHGCHMMFPAGSIILFNVQRSVGLNTAFFVGQFGGYLEDAP